MGGWIVKLSYTGVMNKPTIAYLETMARTAGEILRSAYGNDHVVDHKGAIDLVTEVDRMSEKLILNQINVKFPGHKILAEESGGEDGDVEHLWYVDPLDGTVNYAHGVPIFSVSIAYAHKGQTTLGVVYDPMRDESFTAERSKGAWLNGELIQVSGETNLGQSLLVTGFPYDTWDNPKNNLDNFAHFAKLTRGVRRLGSAALDMCYVAAGRFDGFWEIRLQPWDLAAGGLIVEEAGGVVTNMQGVGDYLSKHSVIAANAEMHANIVGELNKV